MKHRTPTCFVILAIAMVSAGAEPAVVTVELNPAANVHSRSVTVGDVAALNGGTAGIRARIAQVDLGDVPAAGQTLPIKAKQIEFRLLLADFPSSSFSIKGAGEVIVTGARDPITAEMVQTVAREALLRRLPWPAEDLSINLVRPIVLQLPQAADWEKPTLKGEPHANVAGIGRSQIDVSIYVNGEQKLTLPVCFQTDLLQKIAVCRFAIKKGEAVTEDKVFPERRPFDTNNGTIIPYETVLGRKLSRAMSPGQMIGSFDLDPEAAGDNGAAVQARQPVKILARLGAVNIVATGEAMQEGRVGQIIRVQNLDSKKVVPGRVTGPGTVEVETGVNQ
jgi:flagellar basal body P-ring formation protein FlgA